MPPTNLKTPGPTSVGPGVVRFWIPAILIGVAAAAVAAGVFSEQEPEVVYTARPSSAPAEGKGAPGAVETEPGAGVEKEDRSFQNPWSGNKLTDEARTFAGEHWLSPDHLKVIARGDGTLDPKMRNKLEQAWKLSEAKAKELGFKDEGDVKKLGGLLTSFVLRRLTMARQFPAGTPIEEIDAVRLRDLRTSLDLTYGAAMAARIAPVVDQLPVLEVER